MSRKLLILLIAPLFFSFRFSPMTQTIQLDKDQKRAVFEIENPTASPVPIVIKLVQRDQLIDGSENLPHASEIKAYPPQLVVPPMEKRSVRVDWQGGEKLDSKTEKAFRVIAEQVPLDLDAENGENSAGIKMLLRYQAALYVNPGDTASDLVLEKFLLGEDLTLTLHNRGGAHQHLKDVRVRFVHGDRELELSEEGLKALEGHNVLAKTKREFVVPMVEGLTPEFKGVLEFEK